MTVIIRSEATSMRSEATIMRSEATSIRPEATSIRSEATSMSDLGSARAIWGTLFTMGRALIVAKHEYMNINVRYLGHQIMDLVRTEC